MPHRKESHTILCFCLVSVITLFTVSCDLFNNDSGKPVNDNIWVNAYLASWHHNPETEFANTGTMKTHEIDWNAFTHLTYFSLAISDSGTPIHSLNPEDRFNFNTDRIESIVTAAHAHQRRVLFSVGGSGNYEEFSSAITDSIRPQLIQTITSFITDFGFDGVNLSMTPILETDYLNFSALTRELHSQFENIRTVQNHRPLLTVSALKSTELPLLYAQLQHYFDQINILSYDMSQPWRGWRAWHTAALYNPDRLSFDNSPSERFPSVDEKVKDYLAAGIQREKLGISIAFYGAVWEGVHFFERCIGWPGCDATPFQYRPWSQIHEEVDLSDYEWDNRAKAPFLNLADPLRFISFENDRSIEYKINYARKERLGGIMIWELGGGFVQGSAHPDPLLRAVRLYGNAENYTYSDDQ